MLQVALPFERMPGRKRKESSINTDEKFAKALRSGCNMSAVAEVLADEWTPAERMKRWLYKSLGKPAEDLTNYGSLMKTLEIKLQEEETYVGPYVCPFGLLGTVTKSSPHAGEFFEQMLKGKFGKLCIHIDGARLGNVLRPDNGRELQSVTYTFTQFPDWFRCRHGYFPLTYMPAKMVYGTDMSAALCQVLGTCFFSEHEFNLETYGVRLEFSRPSTGITVDFQSYARYGATIADEKAEKEVASVKGASGLKCCQKCSNCVNTDKAIPVESGLVHHTDPDMTKFRQHSPATYNAMADKLYTTVAGQPRQVLEQLGILSLSIRGNECDVVWWTGWADEWISPFILNSQGY